MGVDKSGIPPSLLSDTNRYWFVDDMSFGFSTLTRPPIPGSPAAPRRTSVHLEL
jgi:hypothetical protein